MGVEIWAFNGGRQPMSPARASLYDYAEAGFFLRGLEEDRRVRCRNCVEAAIATHRGEIVSGTPGRAYRARSVRDLNPSELNPSRQEIIARYDVAAGPHSAAIGLDIMMVVLNLKERLTEEPTNRRQPRPPKYREPFEHDDARIMPSFVRLPERHSDRTSDCVDSSQAVRPTPPSRSGWNIEILFGQCTIARTGVSAEGGVSRISRPSSGATGTRSSDLSCSCCERGPAPVARRSQGLDGPIPSPAPNWDRVPDVPSCISRASNSTTPSIRGAAAHLW